MIEADRVREAAREVLGRPEYDALSPSPGAELLERARAWLADAVDAVLGSAAAAGLGRVLAVTLVGLVVAAAIGVLLAARRRSAVAAVVASTPHVDARASLAAADAAAAAGDHDAAVRARYGALVLLLVEAGVLAGRPGLTVGEVDRAVARGMPETADAVGAAGRALADVAYGDTPATPRADADVAGGVHAVAVAAGRRELATGAAGGRT